MGKVMTSSLTVCPAVILLGFNVFITNLVTFLVDLSTLTTYNFTFSLSLYIFLQDNLVDREKNSSTTRTGQQKR